MLPVPSLDPALAPEQAVSSLCTTTLPLFMPQSEQTLRITVNIESEDGVRVKEYSDHSEFLSDLRDWRRYADKRNLRFEEETSATVTLGAEQGPLFS